MAHSKYWKAGKNKYRWLGELPPRLCRENVPSPAFYGVLILPEHTWSCTLWERYKLKVIVSASCMWEPQVSMVGWKGPPAMRQMWVFVLFCFCFCISVSCGHPADLPVKNSDGGRGGWAFRLMVFSNEYTFLSLVWVWRLLTSSWCKWTRCYYKHSCSRTLEEASVPCWSPWQKGGYL